MAEENTEKTIGRNEPCPCGSGKKYKRCCGVNSAPKLSTPKPIANPFLGAAGQEAGGAPGFDPSQMDPQMVAQLTQAFQRLPKGQLQRFQSLMQRAMSGKDVSREAEELEKTLPPDFQQMMMSLASQMQPAAPATEQSVSAAAANGETDASEPVSEAEMTPEEAKRIVEQAVAAGQIPEEQAKELLSADSSRSEGSKISKFWKNLRGKG